MRPDSYVSNPPVKTCSFCVHSMTIGATLVCLHGENRGQFYVNYAAKSLTFSQYRETFNPRRVEHEGSCAEWCGEEKEKGE